MKELSQYKMIFFLVSVLLITTIIGEFSRIEKMKEGMGFGGLITMFIKLVLCFFNFVFMILMIIIWFLQLAFGWFLPKFIPWAVVAITCLVQKFVSIPNCFLWYSLEIFGKTIYLPFRITFAVLDFIFSVMGINVSIQKIVNQIWWFMDDISHALKDGGGIHFIHYPDDVLKRCYSCKIDDFPDLPAFPMGAVNSFIKCIK
jgi:hypothetical protein